MKWEELLSPKRARMYPNNRKNSPALSGPPESSQKEPGIIGYDLRSEFEKDYHRIIGSSAFRRLQDKTQVFPLDKSDFIRTRLTHSLEVSSFARSLGQNISQYLLQKQEDAAFTLQTKADICDILQCAGLIHDIGNPPFGHFGEEAIRDWFIRKLPGLSYKGQRLTEVLNEQMLQDLYHFEGNAQALRQVSKLHFLVNANGMNLTYGLLGAIMKYPVSSVQMNPESRNIQNKKMGYFYSERELFWDIQRTTGTNGCRHPLTFILEAADDIAYRTADMEDAFKKGCISYDTLLKELHLWQEKSQGDLNRINPVKMLEHQYENALQRKVENPPLYAVQNWVVRLQSALIFCATYGFTSHYEQIMEGSYGFDLFKGTYGEWVMEALGDIAYRYAFTSRTILELEIAAGSILNFLMDRMVPAVLYYDTEVPMQMLEQKMVTLISDNYKQIYHVYSREKSEAERLYLRLLLVTDFISGMTDSYAKDLYQKLNGIS